MLKQQQPQIGQRGSGKGNHYSMTAPHQQVMNFSLQFQQNKVKTLDTNSANTLIQYNLNGGLLDKPNGFHNYMMSQGTNQVQNAGFKGSLKSPHNKQLTSNKTALLQKQAQSSDKRSLTEIRSNIFHKQQPFQEQNINQLQIINTAVSQQHQQNIQPTPKQLQQHYEQYSKQQQQHQVHNVYQLQNDLAVMRSNSSFEKQQQHSSQPSYSSNNNNPNSINFTRKIANTAHNSEGVNIYRGGTMINTFNNNNKSRDSVSKQTNSIQQHQHSLQQQQQVQILGITAILDQNYKLPQIQQQLQQLGQKGIGSPQSQSQKEQFIIKNMITHQGVKNVASISSNDQQLEKKLIQPQINAKERQKSSSKQNFPPNFNRYVQKKISQCNSSNNVAQSQSGRTNDYAFKSNQSNQNQQQPSLLHDSHISYEKTNRMTSDKNLTKTDQFKLINNSDLTNQRKLTDDLYYDQGIELDDDNDDDFKRDDRGDNLMYFDQLGSADGQGYDDQDEPEEEDDDVIQDDQIVMEEDNDDEDDAFDLDQKTNNTKTDTVSKISTAAYTEDKKEVRLKKKKTIVRKRTSVKLKKNPYNEGAEDTKNWLAESQTNFNTDLVQPIEFQIKSSSQTNQPMSTAVYSELEPIKVELGADGKPKTKLKEAFLQRPPNNQVVLLKSQFNQRPPTIFFPYPSCLKMQRPFEGGLERLVKHTQDDLKPQSVLGFKINDSTHTYNCVVNSFKTAGFRLMSGGSSWNVLWTGLIKANKIKNVNQYQKINHFPGAWHLGRKDNMWRNVFKMKRSYGQDYNICPTTYIFPEDYKRWCIDREMEGYKHMYIMKPTASSCGRGIKVIGKKTHVNKRSGYLVSKYLAKPHLLRGFKYDMRIYVLVTCFDPLRVYLFEEGLVRLATQQYTTGKSSLSKRFIHLTNFSVNKKAANYVPNQNSNIEKVGEEAPNSSKWSLKQLRAEYQTLGIDFNATFEKIKDVIIKTIIAVEPHIVTNMKQTKHRNACFELYGFDIILDEKLKPWLLEVNVCPSLSSSSPLDKQIKTMLLSDILHLIGLQVFDRKKLEKEQERINKQRLLGFESQKKNLAIEKGTNQPLYALHSSILSSPSKQDKPFLSNHNSPERNRRIMEYVEGLVDEDYDLLADLEEELSRKGHFNRIFPLASNIDTYSKFFETQRHANQVLWNYLKLGAPINIIKSHFK